MTTDTAVRVTRMVVQEGCKNFISLRDLVQVMKRQLTSSCGKFSLDTLDTVPYLDHPDIKFNEHESTEMPFRYVADSDGKPIMPEVSYLCTTLSSSHVHYP